MASDYPFGIFESVVILTSYLEEMEDTKWLIRIRKAKKNRPQDDQTTIYKTYT